MITRLMFLRDHDGVNVDKFFETKSDLATRGIRDEQEKSWEDRELMLLL